MRIKHKLLSDYQYIAADKKIFLIKAGTIIIEYQYNLKETSIGIDRDIIEANPQIFSPIDWQSELLIYIKAQKLPSPAALHKKIVPFIQEMALSSAGSVSTATAITDTGAVEALGKELEWKEIDLNHREKRIVDREQEIELRLKRVETRESSYKEELKSLDQKEDALRLSHKDLGDRELLLEEQLQELNQRERNLDLSLLESTDQLDVKYKDLQLKIDADLKIVTTKEEEVEKLARKLQQQEYELASLESILADKARDSQMASEEFLLWSQEVLKLDAEIKEWEKLHWKFRRTKKPPSAE